MKKNPSRQTLQQRRLRAEGGCVSCWKPVGRFGGCRCPSCRRKTMKGRPANKVGRPSMEDRPRWERADWSLPVKQVAHKMGVTPASAYAYKRKHVMMPSGTGGTSVLKSEDKKAPLHRKVKRG